MSFFNIIFEIKFNQMVQEKLLLKPEIITQITGNSRIQNRLQLAFNISYFTARRWIQDNNVILTTVTALNIISEETKIPVNDLLSN